MKEQNETITHGSGKLTKSFWVLTVVGGLALVYYFGSQLIQIQAIQGCMQVARLETKTDKGETVTVPENYWYNQCLTETGYKK